MNTARYCGPRRSPQDCCWSRRGTTHSWVGTALLRPSTASAIPAWGGGVAPSITPTVRLTTTPDPRWRQWPWHRSGCRESASVHWLAGPGRAGQDVLRQRCQGTRGQPEPHRDRFGRRSGVEHVDLRRPPGPPAPAEWPSAIVASSRPVRAKGRLWSRRHRPALAPLPPRRGRPGRHDGADVEISWTSVATFSTATCPPATRSLGS